MDGKAERLDFTGIDAPEQSPAPSLIPETVSEDVSSPFNLHHFQEFPLRCSRAFLNRPEGLPRLAPEMNNPTTRSEGKTYGSIRSRRPAPFLGIPRPTPSTRDAAPYRSVPWGGLAESECAPGSCSRRCDRVPSRVALAR